MEAPRLCVVGRPDASAAACRLSWSALPPAGIQKGIKKKKKNKDRGSALKLISIIEI